MLAKKTYGHLFETASSESNYPSQTKQDSTYLLYVMLRHTKAANLLEDLNEVTLLLNLSPLIQLRMNFEIAV